MRPKTVALVNHTAQWGGAELALKRLVLSMDHTQWVPVLIFGENGPAVDALRNQGVETYVLPMPAVLCSTRRAALSEGGLASIRRWIALIRYSSRMASFFKERAVDLVHTNSMKAHLLGGLAARFLRIPVFWHVRDSIEDASFPKAAVRALRFLAKHLPSRVICVSHAVARTLCGKNGNPLDAQVVYDGLEASAFERPAEPRDFQCRWRIGLAGRLSPWKGQHIFLEAAAALRARGYPVEFEIVGGALFGEEEYARGLERQVQVLGLGGCVTFSGFVTDVWDRMRTWDVCVHASTLADPCPNVVLEAMAAGVPVVASAGGGVPELLDGGRLGEIYPMGDSGRLSEAIEGLLLDSERRKALSLQGREHALKHFRAERATEEIEKIWTAFASDQIWARRKWPWLEDGLAVAWRGR